MRYQRVIASKREINFARQFFRISLFIMPVQQNLTDSLPKCFRREIALNSPPMANRNAAGLLGDNDRHRVGFFGDPERCAMAQAETAIQSFALAHRKNAGRSSDSAVPNDYAAVMQRRFRMENAQDQLD